MNREELIKEAENFRLSIERGNADEVEDMADFAIKIAEREAEDFAFWTNITATKAYNKDKIWLMYDKQGEPLYFTTSELYQKYKDERK